MNSHRCKKFTVVFSVKYKANLGKIPFIDIKKKLKTIVLEMKIIAFTKTSLVLI